MFVISDSYCTININMNTSEVTAPEIYVDAVIFQLIDNELSVLLTQRERNPFSGKWALPG